MRFAGSTAKRNGAETGGTESHTGGTIRGTVPSISEPEGVEWMKREKLVYGAGGLLVALACVAIIAWGLLGLYSAIVEQIG